jgi:hypothetical protein
MTKKRIILILLLGAVGLIGLFIAADMFFVGASWWPFHHERAPILSTAGVLRGLYMDILYFHDEKGRYPKDLKELRDWMGIEDNNDPRIKYFFDGWKHLLKYEVKNPKLNLGKFDLYSVGKNGVDEYHKPDFGDDIHVMPDGGIRWPPKKR